MHQLLKKNAGEKANWERWSVGFLAESVVKYSVLVTAHRNPTKLHILPAILGGVHFDGSCRDAEAATHRLTDHTFLLSSSSVIPVSCMNVVLIRW